MNEIIRDKMADFKEYNGAKQAWFTAKEWSEELGMELTPQRLTAMYKAGLVERARDRKYYGDNNYRYDVKQAETPAFFLCLKTHNWHFRILYAIVDFGRVMENVGYPR